MGEAENLGLPELLIAGIIGMLLLALAIIGFFIIYQRRLIRQQEEMNRLESEYQQELLHASIRSQEEERKRIAGDLHDSVGALLSATKLYLKQIDNVNNLANLPAIKTESLNLVNETIVNVRQISHNLLPPTLERFGFVAAVEDLADKINQSKAVRFNVQSGNHKRFGLEREVGLYRIVQELTNNTIKHAEAEVIEVSIEFDEENLRIIYEDDGKGFDWEKQQSRGGKKGLGLRSIASRANYLNAAFDFPQQTEKGMRLHLSVPLSSNDL